jgi:L-alanine-DL-glutamate epimerase-like enolase superfamily enzyme
VFPLLLAKLDQPGGFEPTERGLILAGSVIGATIRGNGAAKCAVDIALHDLVGKILGLAVHVIRDLPAVAPPTDFTIGIDEPAIVAERARRAADFPALKKALAKHSFGKYKKAKA